MTVLQMIIDMVKGFKGGELHPANLTSFLEANLPAEEQQIRDVWRAAQAEAKQLKIGRVQNDIPLEPDIEIYITNLKTIP